jgi:hypothetical protein
MGHTPGNLVVEIKSDGEEFLYLGDVFGHPLHLQHPEWYLEPDCDPSLNLYTRRALFERAAPITRSAWHFISGLSAFPAQADAGSLARSELRVLDASELGEQLGEPLGGHPDPLVGHRHAEARLTLPEGHEDLRTLFELTKLDTLPGTTTIYLSWKELHAALRRALGSRRKIASSRVCACPPACARSSARVPTAISRP